MPRPRMCRMVFLEPGTTYFKPMGVRRFELEENTVTVDEFESVRLKDLLGLEQGAAAEKMKISQPTFNRLLHSARRKIVDALVNGKAIRIEGGNYAVSKEGFEMRGRRGGSGFNNV